MDGWIDRQIQWMMDSQIDMIDGWIDIQTDITDGQMDRQTDRYD